MTEKLYYLDAYLNEFTATVTSCVPAEAGYEVTLDRTAFFPEEGGQYSDEGTLGESRVLSVVERGDSIVHLVDKPLPVGSALVGRVDFEDRFEKMQCHTAEHVVSGLLHSFFGCDNVGFHLGRELVTLDVNVKLEREDVVRAELAANRAVFENVAVEVSYPTPEELSQLEYRSKLDITENVRIVTIGSYDVCACCAPHVRRTGEVGIIRLVDFTPHRGGTRITLSAGYRALRESRTQHEAIRSVSAALSVPRDEIVGGVEKLLSDCEALRLRVKSAREELLLHCASEIKPTAGNALLHCRTASVDELRVVANAAAPRVGGILVLLAGEEGALKYLVVSQSVDLRQLAGDMNLRLAGRGGGKPEAIQGSFGAPLSAIREYFGIPEP